VPFAIINHIAPSQKRSLFATRENRIDNARSSACAVHFSIRLPRIQA
jgi:hypothetical protein